MYNLFLGKSIFATQCPKCNRTYKNKSSLASHMLQQCIDAKYQCSYCFKMFKRHDRMRQHVANIHERGTGYWENEIYFKNHEN